MTDKPITIPTIRIPALRGGRMTQMRVPLKRLPLHKPQPHTITYHKGKLICRWWSGARHDLKSTYNIGDRLWVREAHYITNKHAYRLSTGVEQAINPCDDYTACVYKSGFDRSTFGLRLRSPVTMPRWASRTTLVVNDVRVQRVQEISEADAIAEGAGLYVPGHGWIDERELAADPGYSNFLNARLGLEAIWNTLHGPDAWGRNDWVCAISFDVHRCNIDQMPGDV